MIVGGDWKDDCKLHLNETDDVTIHCLAFRYMAKRLAGLFSKFNARFSTRFPGHPRFYKKKLFSLAIRN